MKSGIYKLVEHFVFESFRNAGREHEIRHLERTVYWLKQLYPDADEAIFVAAISHDIERAFRKETMSAKEKELGLINLDFFRIHEERGADIMAEFLKENNQSQEFIKTVHALISRHEEGGNKEQNMLKDADSLSFLENNIGYFVTDKVKSNGLKMVGEKIHWMYERITMPEAKELALPFYQDAVKMLNTIT